MRLIIVSAEPDAKTQRREREQPSASASQGHEDAQRAALTFRAFPSGRSAGRSG